VTCTPIPIHTPVHVWDTPPPLPVSPLIYPLFNIAKQGVNDPSEISGKKFLEIGLGKMIKKISGKKLGI
jgi:hypothetical protein